MIHILAAFYFNLLLGTVIFIFSTPVSAEGQQFIFKNNSQNLSAVRLAPTLIPKDLNKLSAVLRQLDNKIAAYPQNYEANLLKVLFNFKAGKFDAAINEVNNLIQQSPQFHLAHLIKGDLLLAHVSIINGLGENSVLDELSLNHPEDISNLQKEAKLRLKSWFERLADSRLPKQLLKLGYSVKTAIVVDKGNHRLYVYQRQEGSITPKLIDDFYVSTGKVEGNKVYRGDLRTPEGVYFVTSWIPDKKLPDKYGIGAFPVNYPNELDKRLGKTGNGIWLHGTERKYYSRPPLDSEGCMVVSNSDLQRIRTKINPGVTPIIITDHIDWLSIKNWNGLRGEVMASLEQWRKDWQSMNIEKYLKHYSKEFFTASHNLQSWQSRKRLLAKAKIYQNINISDLSLFTYPDLGAHKKNNIVVARFKQDYSSNNFNSEMNKRLYLRHEQQGWRILYEGK